MSIYSHELRSVGSTDPGDVHRPHRAHIQKALVIVSRDDLIDELREEIRQLKALLVPKFMFPKEWNLTPREADVLALMVTRNGYPVSNEDFLNSIWRDEERDIRNINVNIWKLRKKLEKFGFTIKNSHGTGYFVDSGLLETIKLEKAAQLVARGEMLKWIAELQHED